MSDVPSECDDRLALLLTEALDACRGGETVDVAAWQARHPALADKLPGLLETLLALDTAVQDWKTIATPFPGTLLVAADTSGPAGAPTLPAQVGRYRILRHIGRGGMGTVYKAEDPQLQRVVALKVPRFEGPERLGETTVKRFLREARAMAQVRHPHVCPIYDVGEQDGVPYVVMDYVEGQSLADRLAGGRRYDDPAEAVRLARQVAEGLEAVHARGLVHRDLKPGNILLDARGRAVLTDFGLARSDQDEEHLTADGALVGTPAYMAPEQASLTAGPVGPRTDVYSLGVVLYRMLSGRTPFEGTVVRMIYSIAHEMPSPLRRLREDLDPALEEIVHKALARRPEERYASAREFADTLARWSGSAVAAAEAGTPARSRMATRPAPTMVQAALPDGGTITVTLDAGAAKPEKMNVTVREQRGRKKRRLLAVSVTLTLGLLVAVGLGLHYSAQLAGQLDRARADERLARQREQEEREGRRLSRLQNEAQKQFDEARLAVAARDWANARLHLTNALAAVGTEPGLDEVREPARALLDQVEQELRVEADRRDSQARFQKFVSLRDEAQFLGTLYTGMDLAANLEATRTTAWKALAVYGVSAREDARPALDAYLNDAQKAEILGGCYQLLLTLAEAEAHSASSQVPPGREQCLREALGLLERARRFGPPSRAYHLRRARYLGLLGDGTGAASEEKAAADASVLHVLDHFLVGDELYRREKFEEAIKEFDQVLQEQSGHFWAQYLSALCLLRLHRPAEARAQLSACLAQRPDFVWPYLLRGVAQGELRAYDAADADYEQAAQMDLDDDSRYVLLVNRGVLRVREERFDQAVADLKAATELKPKEYQAYVNLALAYRRQKKLDLALEQLNQAVRLEPGLALPYRLRARLYVDRKEPAPALKDFDEALRLETTNSQALADDHVDRGRLLLLDRKYPEALESFDKALDLRKDHPQALRLRGEALFQLRRYKDAIEAFDRYLETGKPLESVYRGRGLAKAELGMYPGAIEDYTKALELEPTSAVQTYRAWAYLACDAPKLALRDFELAIQLDAKNAEAYAGRGFVLASQGHPGEAVRDAKEAVRLGPESPQLLVSAARVYAQAAAQLKAEPGHEDSQAGMRDHYQDRALLLLRRALDLTPADGRKAYWRENVLKDEALAPIRSLHGFDQLAKSFDLR